MKSLLFIFSLLIGSAAFASGQAVYVVRCGAGAKQMFVPYSIWNSTNPSKVPFVIDEKTPFADQVEKKNDLLKRIDPVMALAISNKMYDFTHGVNDENRVQVTSGFQWVESIDEQIDIPEGLKPDESSSSCPNGHLIPVVAISYLDQKTKHYLVNRHVWEKISEGDKAISLVNLFMYELASERYEQGSSMQKAAKRMQYVAAILFSSQWDEFTSYDYLSSLDDMGIIKPDRGMLGSNFGIVFNGVPFAFVELRPARGNDEAQALNYQLDRKNRKIVFVRGHILENATIRLVTGDSMNIRGGVGSGHHEVSEDSILFSDGSFKEMDTETFWVHLRDGSRLNLGDANAEFQSEQSQNIKNSFDASNELLCARNNGLSEQIVRFMDPVSIPSNICVTLGGELAMFHALFAENYVVAIQFQEKILPVYGDYKNPKFFSNYEEKSSSVTFAFCGKYRGFKVDGRSYQGIHTAELYVDGHVVIEEKSAICTRDLVYSSDGK